MLAYIPAKTSSIITPNPPGNSSIFLIYNGLMISKNLKRSKAVNTYGIVTGINNKLMHIPATSSITTRPWSLPQSGSTLLPLHIPSAVIMPVIIKAIRPG